MDFQNLKELEFGFAHEMFSDDASFERQLDILTDSHVAGTKSSCT